ncbi:pyridoxamine 5'-phosphate oxidase family protein [Streptomyces sp. NBC_01477]|uniref:pyridoxamine 5'-phosphate oxidase family protein n=1 Tax=Streptomyces sp. NBC_01477 TaxID=2976015 RepID=UPI002E34DC88|nr:pyridoxamine 5'-phosphate oxidase family protein [Streptomyces sp. NBC_01477]
MAGRTSTDGHRADRDPIVRRIAERRAQLGLSESALSTRAAMSPRYLQHLLDTGPGFDPGGLLRVAAALDLTYQELLEGRGAPPPGQPGPGPRPVLEQLTAAECWDKLGTHGVGRVAVPVQPGPAVLPVNYTVDDGAIVYRTSPGDAAAPAPGEAVSFQVDRVDDHLSRGWSVLLTGIADRIEDPAQIERLAARAAEPWAGGDRAVWIRIRPGRVTGRTVDTR